MNPGPDIPPEPEGARPLARRGEPDGSRFSAHVREPAGPGANLPPALIHGIEAAVVGPADPVHRSATLTRIVEELYLTLAWTLGDQADGADGAELASFAQVLTAAYAHENRTGRTSATDLPPCADAAPFTV